MVLGISWIFIPQKARRGLRPPLRFFGLHQIPPPKKTQAFSKGGGTSPIRGR